MSFHPAIVETAVSQKKKNKKNKKYKEIPASKMFGLFQFWFDENWI